MTVLSVDKDASAQTLAITAEFDAPVDNVWQLWADPRLFERWWGPPEHPTTVQHYDLTTGGTITYVMASPDGNKVEGTWNVIAVDEPTRLVFEDADLGDDGLPADGNGITRMEVVIASEGAKSRMVITTFFAGTEGMEHMLSGFEEGMHQVIAQMEALLAA